MLKWSKVPTSSHSSHSSEIVMSDSEEAPQPRLCHVLKRENFAGYGFNLHTERNKVGQLIGKVDPGSPSADAGLKEGDRIIAINGVHVGQENHTQVVERIKAGGSETRLLVADKECESWHSERGVVITVELAYIKYLSSGPDTAGQTHSRKSSSSSSSSSEEEETERRNNVIEEEEEEEEEAETATVHSSSSSSSSGYAGDPPSPAPIAKQHSDSEEEEDRQTTKTNVLPRKTSLGSSSSSSSSSGSSTGHKKGVKSVQMRTKGAAVARSHTTSSRVSYDRTELVAGLELNMSAKEMRAKVSGHKKADPRADKGLDFWKKSEIIKNL